MGTQDTENTWPVVFCTEAMLFLRMSTLPLLLSRLSDLFNLSTGVQLASRSELITNHQQSYQVVILPRFNVLFACCPIPQLLLKPGLVLTISLILCTPRELLSTGTSEKVWKKVNSPKPVRIWLPSKRTTKKLELIPLMLKEAMKVMNIKFSANDSRKSKEKDMR